MPRFPTPALLLCAVRHLAGGLSSTVARAGLLGLTFSMALCGPPSIGEEATPAPPKEDAAVNVEPPRTGPLPGHSSHGEAFDDGPRQRAYLMGGTGRVHLPITSQVVGVQQLFDQGVGQLHGFWYWEAERSFRQAAALDPNCAMAYWGMAMANTNTEKRAKVFIEKAVERKQHASPREVLWIDGLAAYYKSEKKDEKARRRDFVRSLEQIVQDFPDELEAKAFLAVHIWQNSSHGLPISSHQAVDSLLNEVFAAEPRHPAHHYRIHLWDKEKPARALQAAASCGAAAPAIAHMWHMPGHTYSALHRYAEAAWQQEASARVDHAHMIRDRILPDQIHNYAHNNEWLIRDLVHVGRVRDAVALAKNMIELPRHPTYNVAAKSGSAQYGRTRLIDVLTQYELWQELINLSRTAYLAPSDIRSEQIKLLRALGVAYLSIGDVPAGKEQIAALDKLLAEVRAEQQTAGEEAEKKARDEKKSDEQIAKAKTDASNAKGGDAKPIEKALAELNARVAILAQQSSPSEKDAVQSELAKADDLSKETQALLTAETGELAKAEKLAREAVEKSPGEALPLAISAGILWREGKKEEAKADFEKLRALSAQFDLDTPVFRRLASLVQELGLPDDWRVPATVAADFGPRPALDTLGPLRWHPPVAEPWSLADADGQPLSSRDFHGRPVVVVFYLGFGCLHCVDQFKAIEAERAEFSAAGIPVVAISTETDQQLKTALTDAARVQSPPWFPLVADPTMQVFRLYRAYDDFENQPLHATFLIDGAGLVRWQDIGPEPFMDMKFLLKESQRLLQLPAQ